MPKKKIPTQRLDEQLVQRGLAKDRKEAQALVLAGQVLSGDTLLDHSAKVMPADQTLRIRGRKTFASRGGDKLEAALVESKIEVKGLTCLDLGSSTGGFTHCLLERGAAKVYAVEKGYHQLAYALTQDPRVVSWEGKDALELTPKDFPERLGFACADISFMGLRPFFPLLSVLLPKGCAWIFLVKPQFELPASKVGQGGIVRNDELRQEALDLVWKAAQEAGLNPTGSMASPVSGAKGNREWLLWGHR
jgi:23S rRNA (cytidine1920-2'-O)/16S rRNA (cytidine1409-2'-O)-methyltransferase